MTSNWDPTTGLDDTSRRVQRMFSGEIKTRQLPNVTVEMQPVSANNRNPSFIIHTPAGTLLGVIAQEDAAHESDSQLREIAVTHLTAALESDEGD